MKNINHNRPSLVCAAVLMSFSILNPFVLYAQVLPTTDLLKWTTAPAMPVPESGIGASAEKPQSVPVAVTPSLPQQRITVKGFRFTGHTAFSVEQLQEQVKISLPAVDIGLSELNQVADQMTRLYRQAGYVAARAYIPQQYSVDGIIRIAIQEGRHAKRTLVNTTALKDEFAQALLQDALCQNQSSDCVGAIVQDVQNERAIRVLNELPGVSASATINPGPDAGTSVLAINLKPSPALGSNVGIDNYGSKSTGVYRVNAATEFNNLRGEGDQLILSGSTSNRKIWSANLSYSVLAGFDGSRVGVSVGHSQYLLGDAFSALNSHGDSNSVGGFVMYPALRHRNYNLSLRASVDYKVLKDSIEVTSMHFDKRNTTYALSTYGDWFDGLGGYNNFSLGLNGGNLRMLDINSQLNDQLAQTAGRYRKMVFSLTHQQTLMGTTSILGSINGQTTNRNLDGSEKIGLSGPGGVRGYPAGEAGGDKGAIATLELRQTHTVASNTTLIWAGFVDRGWARANTTPWAGLTNAPTRGLTGYGSSLSLVKPFDYTARLIWATHPANKPSVVDPTAKNQVWLQLSKSY